jgi:uncharacterized protein with HEPN domain
MHPKSPKWLDDVARACQRIETYTDGFGPDDYEDDRLVRDAVERNLTIIGEALSRLAHVDPHTAARVPDLHQIVAVRHRLAHGYDDDIDDARIWTIIRDFVPPLRTEVERLLEEAESLYREDA